MISYRFKRRAFLTAMSGGVGLKIMLRNMEAAAQTTKSPARLLVTHWPVGIVAGSGNSLFTATSGSVGGSMGLQPFNDAALGPDMTVVKGISTPNGAGGSHEGGQPALVTGVGCPGTRAGEQEGDDGYAGGPSFEQVLLANVAALKVTGSAFSYKNVACDTRTDWGETSTKCMSYSTQKQTVPQGVLSGSGQENIPNPSTLQPLSVYNDLFMNFVPPAFVDPGDSLSAAAPAADALLTNLASRKSVLDFAAGELNQLKSMGPADARMKLQNHYDAIMQMEGVVGNSINNGYPNPTGTGGMGGNMMGMGGMGGSSSGQAGRGGTSGTAGAGGRGGTTGSAGNGGGGRGGTTGSAGTGGSTGTGGTTGGGGSGGNCKKLLVPPANIKGTSDGNGGVGATYGNPQTGTDDAANLQAVGAAHYAVLKAAFICDVIRCGTFLWAPGTNHIGFKNIYPGSANVYQHHPSSHKIVTSDTTAASTPGGLPSYAQLLFNVQLWLFTRQAENLKDWKNSYDGFGNSLLDYTVVPFVTEVLATGHERSQMPAMIIGGKSLGFGHNKYQTGNYTVNQFWGTIGQAFGYTSTAAPFAAPISGLWTKPA